MSNINKEIEGQTSADFERECPEINSEFDFDPDYNFNADGLTDDTVVHDDDLI